MIRAVVLAAGASSRMGQAKAALPLGTTGETVLSRVVRTLLAAGVPGVTVVAGAHIDAVRRAMPAFAEASASAKATADRTAGEPARHDPRVRVIEHAGWEQGQLSSLIAGLDAVDTAELEGVLVTLVDVPLVRPETVAAVVAAWRRTRAPIVRPVDGNRHGHPVVFDRAVFAELRAADPNIGAKAVFAAHRDHVLDVEVKDEGAFSDMDTPEDYEAIASRP